MVIGNDGFLEWRNLELPGDGKRDTRDGTCLEVLVDSREGIMAQEHGMSNSNERAEGTWVPGAGAVGSGAVSMIWAGATAMEKQHQEDQSVALRAYLPRIPTGEVREKPGCESGRYA